MHRGRKMVAMARLLVVMAAEVCLRAKLCCWECCWVERDAHVEAIHREVLVVVVSAAEASAVDSLVDLVAEASAEAVPVVAGKRYTNIDDKNGSPSRAAVSLIRYFKNNTYKRVVESK